MEEEVGGDCGVMADGEVEPVCQGEKGLGEGLGLE